MLNKSRTERLEEFRFLLALLSSYPVLPTPKLLIAKDKALSVRPTVAIFCYLQPNTSLIGCLGPCSDHTQISMRTHIPFIKTQSKMYPLDI